MKTFVSALLCIATCASPRCQTNPDRSVNMYFNTFLNERQDLLFSATFRYPETWISHAVSFGYQWNHSEKLINEIEIMPIRYCHINYMENVFDSLTMDYTNEGYDNQIYYSSVRYSYSYSTGFKKVNLMFGCAGKLFYYNNRIKPYASGEYFRSVTAGGLTLEFLPALQYMLTRNISIRFDIPLSMADFDFIRSKNENPALERRHQISDQIGVYLMRRTFQFRIGLSCKIGDSLK